MPSRSQDNDPTAESRKKDHIELAFKSQLETGAIDPRFFYEPMLAAHPDDGLLPPVNFLGFKFRAPLWVSSMTGGTSLAGTINRNLARACSEFGFGMGLGSCRQLLNSRDHLADFDVRDIIGPELPFFANLGIAQLDELLVRRETEKIEALVGLLRADGLIIHVNPLQEALQPEGDHFRRPPIETIDELLEQLPRMKFIVKEVGQGMGPQSLKALMQRPLEAIEFAAAGGTNFSKLELLRRNDMSATTFLPLTAVGHSAAEMLEFAAQATTELGERRRVNFLIISGGIRHFLDGYYLLQKSPLPSVFGQASEFLRHAQGEYEVLHQFITSQIAGLGMANAWLSVR